MYKTVTTITVYKIYQLISSRVYPVIFSHLVGKSKTLLEFYIWILTSHVDIITFVLEK